jgi:hypothetical protein
MREFVQGWRLKWFYLTDSSVDGCDTCLPRFVDVLEVVSKKSWRNIMTVKEKSIADKLFEKVLQIKESEGQTMIGPKKLLCS